MITEMIPMADYSLDSLEQIIVKTIADLTFSIRAGFQTWNVFTIMFNEPHIYASLTRVAGHDYIWFFFLHKCRY